MHISFIYEIMQEKQININVVNKAKPEQIN